MVLLQDIFVFDHRAAGAGAGQSLGQLRATGLRPQLMERLEDRGVKVEAAVFGPSIDVRGHIGMSHNTLQATRTNGRET
jgi:pilus assembly protein CpaF